MAEQAAARIYLLWGEDALSRDELVRSFRTRMLARPGGELNLSEFHAPELRVGEVITACDALPFLDDRRLVIVHGLFGWRPRAAARRRGEAKETDGGQLKGERETFLAYLPRVAPQTTLILVEPALSPAQRAELQRHLPKDRADVRAFEAPRGAQLERWLAKRAQRHGGGLAPGVAGLLREHGPGALEALDQEVAKLVTYAGGAPVTAGDLQELLSGGEILVFGLLDALAERRAADALAALRRLYRQGLRAEELTPQVIALYRRLLVCRLALEARADPEEIARRHAVKIFDKLRGQARGWSPEQCLSTLERLLDFDRKLKRGEVEAETGLELLVAELAGAPSAPASARR